MAQHTYWRRVRRQLKFALLSLLAVLLVLMATVTALLKTETGSRWAVQQAAGILDIELGAVRGNLLTGLDIASLNYQQGAQRYSAQQLSFRWRPISLWYGALSIQALSAEQIRIQLPASSPSTTVPEPFSSWPSLRLPLRIELGKISLRDIQLQQGEQLQQWRALSGSLSLGTFHLRYHRLKLVHDHYGLDLNGRTDLDYPYATEAQLEWLFAPPGAAPVPVSSAVNTLAASALAVSSSASSAAAGAPQQQVNPVPALNTEPLRYAGQAQLKGSLEQLNITHELTSPVQVKAEVQVQPVNTQRQLQLQPQLKLALQWQAQTLPAAWWLPNQPQPISAGQLSAEGTWNNYRAQLEGSLAVPQLPALNIVAQVQGDLDSIQLQQLQLREHQDRVAANAASAQDPAASAAEPIAFAERPAELALSGEIRWSPELEGQLQVEAKALNLAQFISDWPSMIDGHFNLSGGLSPQHWHAQVKALKLSGSLRGRTLEAVGGLGFDGARWHSDGLAVIMGANQLHLSGSLADNLDLQWNLRAPMLNQLDTALQGSVDSHGKILGKRQLPQVSLQLDLRDFAWRDYSVDSLQLQLQPAPAFSALADAPAETQLAPEATSSPGLTPSALLGQDYVLDLTAKQLRLAQQSFSLINFKGQGSALQHQLAATLKSTRYGKLELAFSGQYLDELWQGQLQSLELRIKKVPRWWLASSKPIQVSAAGMNLPDLCLTTANNLTSVVDPQQDLAGAAAWYNNYSPAPSPYKVLLLAQTLRASPVSFLSKPQLCLNFSQNPQQGMRLQALLDSVPLRQFYGLFKTEVYFAGVMDGRLSLATKTYGLDDLQASANISTRAAELRYQYVGGGSETYPWRDFGVNAQLRNGVLDAKLGMEWLGYGKLKAETQLDLKRQLFTKGELQAAFDKLAPLETLLNYTSDVQGDLTADLSWRGSLQAPQLQGQMQLRGGSAKLPRLGINLEAIEAQLSASPDGQLQLRTSLQSGAGTLQLLGTLDQLGSDSWQMQGEIAGDNVQLLNLPQLKAKLSPQLRIDANARELNITGSALIPWARANIKTLPQSAVQVSSDVVIVDARQGQQASGKELLVHTNIDLALGEDVRFKGFGLNSKLSGKLNLLKEGQRQLFTTGFVSIDEGSYKAYGQNLRVERGRLIFQGSYENPGLDIRAARDIVNAEKKTKVGLEIGGTLQRPRAKVFSIPSYSDSEAMMMLLTGKPISEASKADASMLLSALGGLGVESSGSITAEIAQFFRIDEFEIKSDQGLDQSQLWVGKYLTPKLLVRYVVGIFDQAFSLGLRYQLTEKLRLEAESGEVQSVDLIYKIER